MSWSSGQRVPLIAGAVVVGMFATIAIAGPLIAPYDADTQVGAVFAPPSAEHPLGLDDQGADMLSLVILGARISLLVGFFAAILATLIGAVIGILAGYFGGWTDSVLMRITDYFIVVPVLPLMIVVAAVWGPGLWKGILVIGLLGWTPVARVMRAQVLSVRERGFVRRARAMGASSGRVIWHHVFPHVRGLLVANAVLALAVAIFFEAALAFLGLADVTTVSWGTLIARAFERAAISAGAWWAIVPPGLCIAAVILACNVIGTAVEDAGNPRMRSPHIGRRGLVRRGRA